MKKRGRPTVYSLKTGRALAALIADGASKKQACIDAGVAYPSFMRWQARKKSLRARVEEAARICRAKRWRKALLEGLFFDQPVNFETSSHGHNRHPYRDPNAQPVKWMKLIGWWLVHRVPIDATITPEIEAIVYAMDSEPTIKANFLLRIKAGLITKPYNPYNGLAYFYGVL